MSDLALVPVYVIEVAPEIQYSVLHVLIIPIGIPSSAGERLSLLWPDEL